jgi:hypothetical protein
MSRIINIFSGYKILSKNNNFINIKELNQFKRNSEGKIRCNINSWGDWLAMGVGAFFSAPRSPQSRPCSFLYRYIVCTEPTQVA